MPVKIRLAKLGKRHAPTYRVVVSKTRAKRNGKALEIIGNYNPGLEKSAFSYDKEAFNKWVSNGAQVSDAVSSLISGKYKYKKYNPKAEKENTENTTSKVDTPVEEATEENQE